MAPRKRHSPEQKEVGPKDVGDGQQRRPSNSDSRAQESQSRQHGTLCTKILTRMALSLLLILLVYFSSSKETEKVFASQKETLKHRSHDIPCSNDYKKEISKFKGCVPSECGRLVTDVIVTEGEAAHLLQIAKKGLAFGGSGGGASILDLHSGALSQGRSFINVYQKIKALGRNNIFTEQDFQVYRNVRNKIQQMIAFGFGIEVNRLYLTHPTFFSEMTSRPAKTVHDEYWHVHVDKETYPSFHYTSLLYLNDYGKDFNGGRFVFVGKPYNVTVEPRTGRVSAFTSGAENPHFVEKVNSGARYALTVSFTCDKNYQIKDPSMDKLS